MLALRVRHLPAEATQTMAEDMGLNETTAWDRLVATQHDNETTRLPQRRQKCR